MIALFKRWFGRASPTLAEASARDAPAIAKLHGQSFQRGWSDGEVEALLRDRTVLGHRALAGGRLAGFIMSRIAAGEAEILSIAVGHAYQGRGLARQMLDLHLRRLAGLGVEAVFLEVGEDNEPGKKLYARAGFQEVARRANYYPAPGGKHRAALVLRRNLV